MSKKPLITSDAAAIGQPEAGGSELTQDWKSLPWERGDRTFVCPELGGQLAPAFMSRHFLVLGETGSGKTKSVVEPLTHTCATYCAEDPSNCAAMLVIDPKIELADTLKRALGKDAGKRLIHLHQSKREYRVDFFEGMDRSQLTGKTILEKALEFSPEFKRSMTHGGDNVMWSKRSLDLVERLVDLDLTVRRTGGNIWTMLERRIEGAVTPKLRVIEHQLHRRAIAYFQDNYFDGLEALTAAAMGLCDGTETKKEQMTFWKAVIDIAQDAGVDPQTYLAFEEYASLYPEAYISVLSLANGLLADLSNPEFAAHVSLNPFEPPSNMLSIMDAIETGKILLYTPDTSVASAINVGKVLKTKYFEFTFRRKGKHRAVVYVCDEFQRFITGDRVSGEQNFLDRCRSYRAICVLASQSLNALRFELRQVDQLGAADDALAGLINNTGNKYFFRNTDIDTANRLGQLLPDPPVQDRPHVTAVRPLSSLRVGECYYLLSDGSWGRKTILLT
jgi:hypothetical protein